MNVANINQEEVSLYWAFSMYLMRALGEAYPEPIGKWWNDEDSSRATNEQVSSRGDVRSDISMLGV